MTTRKTAPAAPVESIPPSPAPVQQDMGEGTLSDARRDTEAELERDRLREALAELVSAVARLDPEQSVLPMQMQAAWWALEGKADPRITRAWAERDRLRAANAAMLDALTNIRVTCEGMFSAASKRQDKRIFAIQQWATAAIALAETPEDG